MYGLSWKTPAVVPAIVTGVLQVSPPFVDFETVITFPGFALRLKPRHAWYALPSASNATLGSPETSRNVRLPPRGRSCSSQVLPPSLVAYTPHHASPPRQSLADATMLSGFDGLTAIGTSYFAPVGF